MPHADPTCGHQVYPSISVPPVIVHQQSTKPASWELCPTLPHACTQPHMHMCNHAHNCACVYNEHKLAHTQPHTQLCRHMQMQLCTYVYTHIHNHAAHAHEHMPTRVLKHVHTCGYLEVCRCTHTHQRAFPNMHTCKYACTVIHIRNCRLSAGNLSSSEEMLLVRW